MSCAPATGRRGDRVHGGVRGVRNLETHDPDRYAGHLRLRLVEFTSTRLAFEIDRPQDRLVEVIVRLGARRFREVQRVVNIIFGLNV